MLPIVQRLTYQLLDAVAHIHRFRILHRDIKPQNILITPDLDLRLADFGLGRTFKTPASPYTPEVLTLWYRAPELLLGQTVYTTSVDVRFFFLSLYFLFVGCIDCVKLFV